MGTGTTSTEAARLPEFANPPVIETVLGVQFDPVPSLSNAHLGAFWQSLGPDWQDVSDAPRLEPEFEVFGSPVLWQRGLQIRVGQDPAVRLQIRNGDRTRMIQVQNGRLIYNWIAQADQRTYPSYKKIRPEFDRALEGFTRFIRSAGLAELRQNQWEVTYVNHIPQGTVWSAPADWLSLFRPPLSIALDSEVPAKLESLAGEWVFELEPKRGRLHIQLQHGQEVKEPSRELLILKLTARGPINQAESDFTLDQGLHMGHAIIVRSFASITSPEAHQLWRMAQ